MLKLLLFYISLWGEVDLPQACCKHISSQRQVNLFLTIIVLFVRYLHYVLTKNSTVNETNRGLLVETLRSIAEILIWGDQNDSRVFE